MFGTVVVLAMIVVVTKIIDVFVFTSSVGPFLIICLFLSCCVHCSGGVCWGDHHCAINNRQIKNLSKAVKTDISSAPSSFLAKQPRLTQCNVGILDASFSDKLFLWQCIP